MTDGDHDGFTTQLTATKAHSVEMLLTNAQLDLIMIGLFAINSMIAIFGIVTNIMNIIIFYKLGLALTINYSFFVLAITDLLYVVHGLINNIIWYPLVHDVFFNFSWSSLMYFVAPINVGYSAFGSWVQTIISVERACCIVFPLKVKSMFTRRNITIMFVAMILYQIATATVGFFSMRLKGWDPLVFKERFPYRLSAKLVTNSSGTIYSFYNVSMYLYHISTLTSGSIPTNVCFVTVTISTIFLIVKFKESRKNREKMTGKSGNSGKDARLVGTVITICVIYIIGYLPYTLNYLAAWIFPEFTYFNAYLRNVIMLALYIGGSFQAVSSSVNLFVFFKMNEKYRRELYAQFGWGVKG